MSVSRFNAFCKKVEPFLYNHSADKQKEDCLNLVLLTSYYLFHAYFFRYTFNDLLLFIYFSI